MTSKDKPTADDGSGTAQTEPAAVQTEPAAVQTGPAAAQAGPDAVQNGPDAAQTDPDAGPAAGGGPEPDDDLQAQPQGAGPADAKSAFAAVLARKQQAAQNRTAHLDGHGSVGGATANHKATRTFRRKSG